jgi:hypothetical protein
MFPSRRVAGAVLVLIVTVVAAAPAQTMLLDVMTRHGVQLPDRDFERGFDEGMAPAVPVSAGSFATPLAMMTSGSSGERIAAAFAFGILAGRSGRAASAPELTAAGQALVQMIASDDRRSRVAGARVAGRVFAVPFDATVAATVPGGLAEALFVQLNRTGELDQLAAMDALGLMRQTMAVSSLTERYYFYRDGGKRALAGGALEALARIGDSSTIDVVKVLAADPWSEGRDPTALAVAFARERMLEDGSIAIIQQALDDRSRRGQARGYLIELGVAVP